jgi:hypothetical protein
MISLNILPHWMVDPKEHYQIWVLRLMSDRLAPISARCRSVCLSRAVRMHTSWSDLNRCVYGLHYGAINT